jgi:ATP-dependent DNA ligase
VVFDCLYFQGKDLRAMPHNVRVVAAQRAVSEWGNPFVELAGMVVGSHKKNLYANIIARGGEGVILKHIDHRYGDKTGWVKVKKQATADVVIMGFIPAKEMSKKKGDDKATLTKYAKAGLIGAIQCGQHDHRVCDHTRASCEEAGCFGHECSGEPKEVATVSGMTDDLRAEFTKHPKKYIGKVIEIEHNGREPTGRFRHPRFNRFRDDKRATDCIYREDES